jgi:hypothetical protein
MSRAALASGTLRWRRRAWLVALAAVSVVGTTAAPAGAYDSFDPTTDAPITFDGDSHWWNGQWLLSDGTYQYTAYWDAEDATTGEVYLKLTRRNLATRATEDIRFDGTRGFSTARLDVPNDGHNAISLGLSPNDGRLHISWSNHARPHFYGISSSRCMPQARFADCTFTFTDHQANRATEAVYTYPLYFNDSRGRLYSSYRSGRTQEGDQYLNVYDDRGAWSEVGMLVNGDNGGSFDLDGAWTDTDRDGVREYGEPGFLPTTTDRGVYPWGFEFDKNDRLHFTWAYRERVSGMGNLFLQHGVEYAYSDDFGRTWSDTAGRSIAAITTDPRTNDPIRLGDTTTEVVFFPVGSYPAGWGMKIDPMGQPHIVFPSSDVGTADGLAINFRQTHVWRTPSGRWYSGYITTEGGTWSGFGDLMFDRSGNAYYTHNRSDLDWYPWNDVSRSQYTFADLRPDSVTWQGGDFLNIVPFSAVTALDTGERIGIPIGTGAGANRKITVRMKNNTVGRAFQLYWQTDASQRWDVARGQSFAISANDVAYQTYTFTVTDADWTGTLRALEMYPAGLGDVHGAGKDISIDYIRITDDRGTPIVAKAWEFREGIKVMVSEASSASNWSTWNAPFQFPGLKDASADSVLMFDDQLYKDRKVVSFIANEQGAAGTESTVVHDVDILGDDTIFSRDFAVDVQAWTAGRDVGSFAYASESGRGTISGTVTGADSRIYSEDNLHVPIESATTVRVRLKNTTTATSAVVFFTTDANPGWSGAQSVTIPIRANSDYTMYTADISRATGWRAGEVLRQLRFDPADNASSGTFNLNDTAIY